MGPPQPNRDLMGEIARLQQQMQGLHRSHTDALSGEQAARKRLEDQLRANQDQLSRVGNQVRSSDSGGDVK
jgi:hypothetical protein